MDMDAERQELLAEAAAIAASTARQIHDDAVLAQLHTLEAEIRRIKLMSLQPRHGFLRLFIRDLETNPHAQYTVHKWGMWYWVINFPAVTLLFFLDPSAWLKWGLYVTLIYSIYANFATDYGAMSAAMAAYGDRPGLPAIPVAPVSDGADPDGGPVLQAPPPWPAAGHVPGASQPLIPGPVMHRVAPPLAQSGHQAALHDAGPGLAVPAGRLPGEFHGFPSPCVHRACGEARFTVSSVASGWSGTDIARQSTLLAVQQSLHTIIKQLGVLVSEDATVAAEAADIDARVTATSAAIVSLHDLIAALKSETGLSPATMAALSKADDDAKALQQAAADEVAADTAPAAPAG